MAEREDETTVNEIVREESLEQEPVNGEPEAQDQPAAGANQAAGEASADEPLRAELEETRDRLLRQAAEYQNFRKRTAQERETLVELGKGLVIERMLDVLDDFERSLGAAEEMERQEDGGPVYQALKQGVELVHRKMIDELQRVGLEPIEALDEPFDENLHDALMQQPAPEGKEPGTVIGEVQKGYRLNERVIRHSKVIVATEAAE